MHVSSIGEGDRRRGDRRRTGNEPVSHPSAKGGRCASGPSAMDASHRQRRRLCHWYCLSLQVLLLKQVLACKCLQVFFPNVCLHVFFLGWTHAMWHRLYLICFLDLLSSIYLHVSSASMLCHCDLPAAASPDLMCTVLTCSSCTASC